MFKNQMDKVKQFFLMTLIIGADILIWALIYYLVWG
jgi:hypothetical protein